MRSNCIAWSLSMYLRRRSQGMPGYWVLRRSNYGFFPHALYLERRWYGWRTVSFVPINPRKKACPPLLFVGRVKWGDLPTGER